MTGELTETERDQLADAVMKYRFRSEPAPVRFDRFVAPVVEAVLASRFDQWEWNYGERVRRLESELAATEIKLAAARLALAACREVREGRES